jgi:hypothetical protein
MIVRFLIDDGSKMVQNVVPRKLNVMSWTIYVVNCTIKVH